MDLDKNLSGLEKDVKELCKYINQTIARQIQIENEIRSLTIDPITISMNDKSKTGMINFALCRNGFYDLFLSVGDFKKQFCPGDFALSNFDDGKSIDVPFSIFGKFIEESIEPTTRNFSHRKAIVLDDDNDDLDASQNADVNKKLFVLKPTDSVDNNDDFDLNSSQNVDSGVDKMLLVGNDLLSSTVENSDKPPMLLSAQKTTDSVGNNDDFDLSSSENVDNPFYDSSDRILNGTNAPPMNDKFTVTNKLIGSDSKNIILTVSEDLIFDDLKLRILEQSKNEQFEIDYLKNASTINQVAGSMYDCFNWLYICRGLRDALPKLKEKKISSEEQANSISLIGAFSEAIDQEIESLTLLTYKARFDEEPDESASNCGKKKRTNDAADDGKGKKKRKTDDGNETFNEEFVTASERPSIKNLRNQIRRDVYVLLHSVFCLNTTEEYTVARNCNKLNKHLRSCVAIIQEEFKSFLEQLSPTEKKQFNRCIDSLKLKENRSSLFEHLIFPEKRPKFKLSTSLSIKKDKLSMNKCLEKVPSITRTTDDSGLRNNQTLIEKEPRNLQQRPLIDFFHAVEEIIIKDDSADINSSSNDEILKELKVKVAQFKNSIISNTSLLMNQELDNNDENNSALIPSSYINNEGFHRNVKRLQENERKIDNDDIADILNRIQICRKNQKFNLGQFMNELFLSNSNDDVAWLDHLQFDGWINIVEPLLNDKSFDESWLLWSHFYPQNNGLLAKIGVQTDITNMDLTINDLRESLHSSCNNAKTNMKTSVVNHVVSIINEWTFNFNKVSDALCLSLEMSAFILRNDKPTYDSLIAKFNELDRILVFRLLISKRVLLIFEYASNHWCNIILDAELKLAVFIDSSGDHNSSKSSTCDQWRSLLDSALFFIKDFHLNNSQNDTSHSNLETNLVSLNFNKTDNICFGLFNLWCLIQAATVPCESLKNHNYNIVCNNSHYEKLQYSLATLLIIRNLRVLPASSGKPIEEVKKLTPIKKVISDVINSPLKFLSEAFFGKSSSTQLPLPSTSSTNNAVIVSGCVTSKIKNEIDNIDDFDKNKVVKITDVGDKRKFETSDSIEMRTIHFFYTKIKLPNPLLICAVTITKGDINQEFLENSFGIYLLLKEFFTKSIACFPQQQNAEKLPEEPTNIEDTIIVLCAIVNKLIAKHTFIVDLFKLLSIGEFKELHQKRILVKIISLFNNCTKLANMSCLSDYLIPGTYLTPEVNQMRNGSPITSPSYDFLYRSIYDKELKILNNKKGQRVVSTKLFHLFVR